MRTLLAIVLSFVVLFLLGYINYYIPKEEKDALEKNGETLAGSHVIISSMRFGVLLYFFVSIVMLIITIVVYVNTDFAAICNALNLQSGYIRAISIILHIVAFILLMCVYFVVPLFGEFISEQRLLTYYDKHYGVRVMDSREEKDD